MAPHIAFAQNGAAAVSWSVENADNAARSAAYVAWLSPTGKRSAPQRIRSSQQILGSVFRGSTLELLTGNSPAGDACCSSAGVQSMSHDGTLGRSQTLVRDLSGPAMGRVVTLAGGRFAAVATERGVWVAQAQGTGRFGRVHQLTAGNARPQGMRATELDDGDAVVAWTEIDHESAPTGPRQILLATGSSTAAPTRGHAVVTVAKTHAIDELGLGDGGRANAAAVAWIESWFDRHGNYRSQVVVSDLAHPKRRQTFAVHGTIASGLAFVDNGRGDQVLAWRACTFRATCAVHVVWRRGSGRFGHASRLGSVDAAEVPTIAVAASGEALVGWIRRGHVLAADLRPHATKFAAAQTVSSTDFAADLTVGFGGRGDALAAWSQGTLAPDVMGAVYTP